MGRDTNPTGSTSFHGMSSSDLRDRWWRILSPIHGGQQNTALMFRGG